MEGEDRMTRGKIIENRKREIMEHNTKVFAKEAIGIHKGELPQFADAQDLQEYWKLREGYCQTPNLNSAREFHQKKKYWAKPDLIHLSDVKHESGPNDPFKSVYIAKSPKKTQVALKVQEINPFKSEANENGKATGPRFTNPRWTEMQQLPSESNADENSHLRESQLRYGRSHGCSSPNAIEINDEATHVEVTT